MDGVFIQALSDLEQNIVAQQFTFWGLGQNRLSPFHGR